MLKNVDWINLAEDKNIGSCVNDNKHLGSMKVR
jgi:hypothetical protein